MPQDPVFSWRRRFIRTSGNVDPRSGAIHAWKRARLILLSNISLLYTSNPLTSKQTITGVRESQFCTRSTLTGIWFPTRPKKYRKKHQYLLAGNTWINATCSEETTPLSAEEPLRAVFACFLYFLKAREKWWSNDVSVILRHICSHLPNEHRISSKTAKQRCNASNTT
jgi:hypothetical protein